MEKNSSNDTAEWEETPTTWNVLVCGLPLADESFDLGSALVLRRLHMPLTVFDLAAPGDVGFREWAALEPIASSATAEIFICAISSDARIRCAKQMLACIGSSRATRLRTSCLSGVLELLVESCCWPPEDPAHAAEERFRFALEAAVDWRYAKGPRAAVARIWAGVESLLGISSELVYRVSLTAASVVALRGAERVRIIT